MKIRIVTKKRDVSNEPRDALGRWTRLGRGGVAAKTRPKKGHFKLSPEAKKLVGMSVTEVQNLSDEASDLEDKMYKALVGSNVELGDGLVTAKRFIERLGITPVELSNKLRAALGKSQDVKLNITGAGKSLYIDIEGKSFYAERAFDGSSDAVSHSVLDVFPDARSKGIASALNLAMLDVYDNAGINKINIDTTDVGSYAWLRCGFVPRREDVSTLSEECKGRIEELDETADYIEQVAKARAVMSQVKSDPKAFIAVAALRDVIKNPVTGKRMSLGYYLLGDTKWSGSLDLTDKLRYSIYKGYLEDKNKGKSADDRDEWDDELGSEVEAYLNALIQEEFPDLVSYTKTESNKESVREGRKYNPDWYLQPRKRGQWSTVALKRQDKGHLADWGTGQTSVNMSSMNAVDKRYLGMGFNLDAERMSELLYQAARPALPEGAVPSVTSSYFPSMHDNAMVTVFKMEHPQSGFMTTLRAYNYLDNSPPRLEVAYLKLPYSEQSKGVGKDMLKAYVDLADNLGADNIALVANIDVGGYAWARYGFVPTPDSWKSLCVAVRKNLAQCDFTGSSVEAKELEGHIKTLTAPGADPRNVRAIAALTSKVKHPSLGETKLGFALLKETGWDSVAYMNDKEVMAHLKATCSKEESFDEGDWDHIVSATSIHKLKSNSNDKGVLFMGSSSGRTDAELHKAMLPAGSFVADQVAIRQLMSIGMSRADARRFISSQRGYGG